MTDSEKDSRWAKILADAGLIDDVDDVWELPPGDIHGATIEVTGTGGTRLPEPSQTGSQPPAATVRADSENRMITIESSSTPRRRDDDITMRISTKTAEVQSQEDQIFRADTLRVRNARATVAGMPLARQTPSPLTGTSATGRLPVPPLDKKTDPAPFALQSRIPPPPLTEDIHQRPTREFDDTGERPTIELEPAVDALRNLRDEDDTRQTLQREYEESAALHDSLALLQDKQDQAAQDHVVEVCGTRISIASVPPDAPESGTILDLPVDYGDDALELIAEPDDAPTDKPRDRAISMPPPSLREQLKARYNVGDFSGTLDLANDILKDDPGNIEALNYRQTCRETLLRMYESRIGDIKRVPRLLVSANELMWRNLDPTTGFVLSRFDGMSSFEDVIDISGLPRFETCRIVARLLQDGILG
jgi:hypothetical protein